MSPKCEESLPLTTKQKQSVPSTTTTECGKVIFVTVGTTLFSSLIDNIINRNTISYMVQNNYTHLIIQYGKDAKPNIDNISSIHDGASQIQIELYDFKSSLYDDMLKANIIICHAGAGTLTEAIRISQAQMQHTTTDDSNHRDVPSMKKIVTVINNLLMDNHQTELAYALQRRQLVHVINDPQLFASSNHNVWDDIDAFVPSSSTSLEGNPYDVPKIMHNFFGSRIRSDHRVTSVQKED